LEAKIRRLVDDNVVGIVMFTLDCGIIGANDGFLQMLQYDRRDLALGRLRWTDLTPDEWRERDGRRIAELRATGILQPIEKEYIEGWDRVPVLLGGALFEGSGNEGVAFILDLSEQKRTERALRRSEAFLASNRTMSQTLLFQGTSSQPHDFLIIVSATYHPRFCLLSTALPSQVPVRD
jgi:PAS domain